MAVPSAPEDDRPPARGDVDPRFSWANERTFLAWNRTALALIAGGVAAGQLGDYSSDAIRLAIALPPIVLGAALALSSYRRWQANEAALERDEALPPPRVTSLLAVGVAVLAVVLAVVVIVDAAVS
jgi:putative membrane protein